MARAAAALAATILWAGAQAPAFANLGDTLDQAKARVRARQDVAVAEFWIAKATGKVVRERWRTSRDGYWTYGEALAICRMVIGRKPVTALHHGLGTHNGHTLYYDMMLGVTPDNEPVYGGLTRADFEWGEVERVAQINMQGDGYAWFPELQDDYRLVIHYVAEDTDEE